LARVRTLRLAQTLAQKSGRSELPTSPNRTSNTAPLSFNGVGAGRSADAQAREAGLNERFLKEVERASDALEKARQKITVDALKDWQRQKPELFRKPVYNQATCDT